MWYVHQNSEECCLKQSESWVFSLHILQKWQPLKLDLLLQEKRFKLLLLFPKQLKRLIMKLKENTEPLSLPLLVLQVSITWIQVLTCSLVAQVVKKVAQEVKEGKLAKEDRQKLKKRLASLFLLLVDNPEFRELCRDLLALWDHFLFLIAEARKETSTVPTTHLEVTVTQSMGVGSLTCH